MDKTWKCDNCNRSFFLGPDTYLGPPDPYDPGSPSGLNERCDPFMRMVQFCGTCTSLYQYLIDHEADIAAGFNDYGDLSGYFTRMLGRQAKEPGSAAESITAADL